MVRNLLAIIFSIAVSVSFCQVGINNPTPDPSAALDILSTTQGLLLPRLTTAERDAITSPAPGLVIYNTETECLNFRIPSKWVAVCDCDGTAASAGADQLNVVGLETPLAASGTGSGVWSVISGAEGSFSDASDPEALFSGDPNIVYTLQWTVTDDCGTASDQVDVSFNNKIVIPYTGSDYAWTVPAGITSLTVKLWGAGGGSGGSLSNDVPTGGSGGGGGYATGTIATTPGEIFTVIVGQGGLKKNFSTSAFGGGGLGGFVNSSPEPGGGGGGRSAIRNASSVELITAGGGGGGGGTCCSAGNIGGAGGAGGGSTGANGSTGSGVSVQMNPGLGGTQIAGGAAASGSPYPATAGSQFQGGNGGGVEGSNNRTAGGGGGSGYYGGGGGAGMDVGSSTIAGGGGGGGSSYIGGVSGGSTSSGSGTQPGNNSDADRGAAGNGGPFTNNGNSGTVIIYLN